jgi:serine phosphatase RsbU (regulator of sigma subunit)
VDATNKEGELFGRTRVEEVVQKHWKKTADEIVSAIFNAVVEHTASASQFDDQTVVAMKIRPQGKSANRGQSSSVAK